MLDPTATNVTEQAKKWPIANETIAPDDALLSCLIWFTKLENNPYSAKALTAGLPLVDNRLTPELFLRAAERAELAAQIIKRPLEKFNKLVLPAVLLLKNQQACILLEISRNGGKSRAKIIQPETGVGVNEIDLSSLKESYTGFSIFLKPAYRFTERSSETLAPDSKHWFRDVVTTVIPLYSEVLLASFLINIFGLVVPLFVMNVYDRVVPNHAFETLWVLVTGVLIVFGFDFVLRSLRSYFIDMAGKKVDIRLSSKIFEHIMGIMMAARPGSVGAFANTIQSFETFRDFITSTTVTVLVDLPFTLLYILIIGLIAGSLALIPLIMLPLVIGVGWLLQVPLTELTKALYQHSAEKQATLIETLGGIEVIKSVNGEGAMQRRWEKVVSISSRLGIKSRFFANLGINFSVFAQQLTSVLVVLFGVYKIAAGDITTGALIASTILTGRALAPMSQIAALLTRYYQSVNSLESLNTVMKLPAERSHGKPILHRPKLTGDIEFRNVSFNYPSQHLSALHSVSFHIRPGEHVAIVGRIGSGKTTIAKLLLGLYHPSEGNVMMDGSDIRQVDPADLRHHIGYVPQDVNLFYGSLKENIVMGGPYVDSAAIIKAARVAGLESFTSNHPEGYDLQVGERGSRLSGGQRQAVTVARAVLLDPPLIVLDEPTNAMDDSTESQLKANLAAYMQHKTLVLVTHKASLLSLADRLIVVEAGQIVADGPREEVFQALSEGRIKVPEPQQVKNG
jgi:ATP-binding cassette, subfamily C, bacterial LapB